MDRLLSSGSHADVTANPGTDDWIIVWKEFLLDGTEDFDDFTGEPKDYAAAGSGLLDLRARTHAPDLGRFLQRDPRAGSAYRFPRP